jgi:hypothetical protein
MASSQHETVPATRKVAQDLWYATQAYGAEIWADAMDGGEKPDGQALWQPLKALFKAATGQSDWRPEFSALQAPDGEIGPEPLTFLEAAEGLPEAPETGRTAAEGAARTDDAHYFAQLLRIPLREECLVRRILQIAYNSGQLSGSGALARLGEEWSRLYEGQGLGRLETYCSTFDGLQVPANLLSEVRRLSSPTTTEPPGF